MEQIGVLEAISGNGYSYVTVLLMLLRRPLHHWRKRMSWQMDGRTGGTKVGDSRREGFALMRDQARHLIAFHVVLDQGDGPAPPEASLFDQFVISESDFEPNAATIRRISPSSV